MSARSEPRFLYPLATPGPLPRKHGKRIKTVVADDSETCLEVLCEILDLEAEIDVAEAACDGVEAINAAVRLKPDLVLMDVHMPGLDGLSAASLLSELTPAPIVVLMSSEDSRELRRACQQVGVLAFIPKPFFQQEFPSVREEILRARDEQWVRETD